MPWFFKVQFENIPPKVPQWWALVLPRTTAAPWGGVEISKHVSHDSFQYIYLHKWITEVHQRASKSYYCLLLWISEKTIIKSGRDFSVSIQRTEAHWTWLCFVPCPMDPQSSSSGLDLLCAGKMALQDHCGGERRSFRSPQLGNADHFRGHLKTSWGGPEARAGSEISATNLHPDRIRACTG